jgi:hypothetical protein
MLGQLPQLRGVKLGIHAYTGTEEGIDYPDTDAYAWVQLPALAGVAPLTELALVGCTCLPPDWRQLSSLRRLRMVDTLTESIDHNVDQDPENLCLFDWGTAPLTALTALTSLEVDQRVLPGEGRGAAQGAAHLRRQATGLPIEEQDQ